MTSCSTKSNSSGRINDDNQQQVETFVSPGDQTDITLMLCELKNITRLLSTLLIHIELITDEENING